jgi:hypothetical protein
MRETISITYKSFNLLWRKVARNERKIQLFLLRMRIAIQNLYSASKNAVAIDLEFVAKEKRGNKEVWRVHLKVETKILIFQKKN